MSFVILSFIFITKKTFMGCGASNDNISTTPARVDSAAIVSHRKIANQNTLKATASM